MLLASICRFGLLVFWWLLFFAICNHSLNNYILVSGHHVVCHRMLFKNGLLSSIFKVWIDCTKCKNTTRHPQLIALIHRCQKVHPNSKQMKYRKSNSMHFASNSGQYDNNRNQAINPTTPSERNHFGRDLIPMRGTKMAYAFVHVALTEHKSRTNRLIWRKPKDILCIINEQFFFQMR